MYDATVSDVSYVLPLRPSSFQSGAAHRLQEQTCYNAPQLARGIHWQVCRLAAEWFPGIGTQAPFEVNLERHQQQLYSS